MSKPYEIEYTLYFGMDIPDSSSGSKSSGGSSVTAKAAGNSTKLADGQEAETDAGTVYKDDAAHRSGIYELPETGTFQNVQDPLLQQRHDRA